MKNCRSDFDYRNDDGMKPVAKLYVAILQRAISDLLRDEHFENAREWIFDDPEDAVISFEECCHVLDLDPAHLRRGIASASPRIT